MDERERIEAKLAELTGTPADIAATLREAGIVGRPNEPEHCVIAKWADAYVCKYFQGEFDVYYIEIFESDDPVAIPPHLQHFIALFDSGEFSDLIG